MLFLVLPYNLAAAFFLQKYKEYEKDVTIEEIDGLQLVKKLAKNMEEMFHKKAEAVRVGSRQFSIFILCSSTIV